MPNPFPKVRPIRNEHERERIIQLAREDNDAIDFPTHACVREDASGGESIIGAWSIGAIPLCLAWHHTQWCKPRDTFAIQQTVRSIMESNRTPAWWIACNKHSPYHGHMERLGFRPIWETKLYLNTDVQQ